MTDRVYLPTELGVSGEGSPAGINDELFGDYDVSDVKEVKKDTDPATSTQPNAYKNIEKNRKEGTMRAASINPGRIRDQNKSEAVTTKESSKTDSKTSTEKKSG